MAVTLPKVVFTPEPRSASIFGSGGTKNDMASTLNELCKLTTFKKTKKDDHVVIYLITMLTGLMCDIILNSSSRHNATNYSSLLV